MAAHDRADTPNEVWLSQLFQRQVHRNAAGRGNGALPEAKILADLIEDPLTDFDDEVGFFRNRNEIRWQYQTAIRKFPAHQSLGAEYLASFEVVLGLIVDQQFIALERALEFALGHQALDRCFIHRRGVIREDVAPRLLGAV